MNITLEQPAGEDCPILDLEIGAINLDLLGLDIQTSDICLRIHAEPGEGNLLGNLLCSLSGLLDDIDLDLGNVTSVINRILPLNLNLGLAGVANNGGQLVGLLNLGLTGGGASDSQLLRLPFDLSHDEDDDSCAILNLAIGPVDLNLLGLDIELDDCEGGPVTLDITAERGPGNLLGNLLCGIAGLLDRGLPLDDLIGDLNRLLDRISRNTQSLNQLLEQVDRFVDRLDRLLDRLDRVA